MKKSLFDSWTQLGLLVVAGLTMLGGFAAWCDARYQHADVGNDQGAALKELKAEVDALYLKLIPEQEKAPLHHHEVIHQ